MKIPVPGDQKQPSAEQNHIHTHLPLTSWNSLSELSERLSPGLQSTVRHQNTWFIAFPLCVCVLLLLTYSTNAVSQSDQIQALNVTSEKLFSESSGFFKNMFKWIPVPTAAPLMKSLHHLQQDTSLGSKALLRVRMASPWPLLLELHRPALKPLTTYGCWAPEMWPVWIRMCYE